MSKSKEFYTVMELSDELDVKRTTINDWLSKYSIYIESQVIGKRRTYTRNALAVLKKISDLRAKGLPAFEIEATLSKMFPIHPQPEPADKTDGENFENSVKSGGTEPKSDGNNLTDEGKNRLGEVPNLEPVQAKQQKEDNMLPATNSAELFAKLQQMMDQIAQMQQVSEQMALLAEQFKALPAQLQSQQVQQEPVVVPPPPVIVEKHTKLRIVVTSVLIVLGMAVLAGAGYFVCQEYQTLKSEIGKRDNLLSSQRQKNEEISQQVQGLNDKNNAMEAQIGNLSKELKNEKAEFEKRDQQAQEQLRTEREFRQRESADKERLQREKSSLEADVRKSQEEREFAVKSETAAREKASEAEREAAVARERANAAEKNAVSAQKAAEAAGRELKDLRRQLEQKGEKTPEKTPVKVPEKKNAPVTGKE